VNIVGQRKFIVKVLRFWRLQGRYPDLLTLTPVFFKKWVCGEPGGLAKKNGRENFSGIAP
jgi:hypothetical protein